MRSNVEAGVTIACDMNFHANSLFLELANMMTLSVPLQVASIVAFGMGATLYLMFGASLLSCPISQGPVMMVAARR